MYWPSFRGEGHEILKCEVLCSLRELDPPDIRHLLSLPSFLIWANIPRKNVEEAEEVEDQIDLLDRIDKTARKRSDVMSRKPWLGGIVNSTEVIITLKVREKMNSCIG